LKDPAMKVLVDQAIEALRANGRLAAISQKWFAADVTK
jgi:cystine transport system substrate-binding protein